MGNPCFCTAQHSTADSVADVTVADNFSRKVKMDTWGCLDILKPEWKRRWPWLTEPGD